MKKSIAVLFAAGIFMLSCPAKTTSAEVQVEEVNAVPAVTESSLAAKSVMPPALSVTPSPLPTPGTIEPPEPIDSTDEALPHSSKPESNYEIPASAPAHVHEWVSVKTTVHFEAVMEEIKVVDVPGTEGHFEVGSYEVMVCRCGEVFTSYDGWLTHAHAGGADQHGGFTTDVRCDQVWVEGTPEISHCETVIVQPAYD